MHTQQPTSLSGDTWTVPKTAFSSGPRHSARAWKGCLHMYQMNWTLRSSMLWFMPGRVWQCPSGLIYSHKEMYCGSDRTATSAASTLISLPPLFTTRGSFLLFLAQLNWVCSCHLSLYCTLIGAAMFWLADNKSNGRFSKWIYKMSSCSEGLPEPS